MTQAIIYQPAKNAMQSGKAKTKYWLLEFQRSQPMTPDALMGWTTMSETVPQQLVMRFETREEAVQYAESHGISYVVKAPKAARVAPKAYAENFSFNKRKAF